MTLSPVGRHQRVCTSTKGSVRVPVCWRLGTETCVFPPSVGIAVPVAPEDTLPSSLELLIAQEQYRHCIIISSQKIPFLHCMPSKPLGVFLIIPDNSLYSYQLFLCQVLHFSFVLCYKCNNVKKYHSLPRIIILSFGGYFIEANETFSIHLTFFFDFLGCEI